MHNLQLVDQDCAKQVSTLTTSPTTRNKSLLCQQSHWWQNDTGRVLDWGLLARLLLLSIVGSVVEGIQLWGRHSGYTDWITWFAGWNS